MFSLKYQKNLNIKPRPPGLGTPFIFPQMCKMIKMTLTFDIVNTFIFHQVVLDNTLSNIHCTLVAFA